MTHSVPYAFITVMNAVGTEWVTPGLPRMCISLPRESVVRLTDHLDMGISVDWDVKAQTKQKLYILSVYRL